MTRLIPAEAQLPDSVVSGRQVRLSLGDAVAVVTEVGATLRTYSVGDRDVIVPFGADELAPGCHGAVLAPWPNRLGDGVYDFDGEHHRLPLSEPERDNAIHGLVRHERWTIVFASPTAAEFLLDLVPRPGYPFPLRMRMRYELTANALTVTLTTTNTGRTRAPFGAGFHPWLSPGGFALDDCELEIDAAGWLRTDARLLPIAYEAVPTVKDFSSARRVGCARLDDGFTAPEGASRIRLIAPDGSVAEVRALQGFGYWQVFTGDGLPGRWLRSGLATEPMTCPADAFRSGDGLVVLEPGTFHTCSFALALGRPN